MAVVLLVARPAALTAQNLLANQAISANVSHRIRRQNHWYVVRQSWAFFQNDFAGRIANRVMQTGPARPGSRGISMVTQDASVRHRSIGDNIRYGRPQASDAEIVAAARLAHAHEFILELEDWKQRRGYAAQVGERRVKLSGGQRQRIAIARVILKDAPILVLDEATSALDSEVEAAIQSSLGTLMAGKTVIAIAHRLSTIARMDRLIVLDHGRIVEQGSHDELLRRGGHYAALWRHQSGGFIDAGGMPAAE